MFSWPSMKFVISRSLHTTLRWMRWSNDVITMSRRPSSKVSWEERFTSQQQLTLCSGLNMLLFTNWPDSHHTSWYMVLSPFFLLIYLRQYSLFLYLILMTFLPLYWLLGKLANSKSIRRIKILSLSTNKFFCPGLDHSNTLSCNSRTRFTSKTFTLAILS